MTISLIKCSVPGWTKKFETESELVTELRKHICESCLLADHEYVGEDGEVVEIDYDEPPVDTIFEGVRYECRDLKTLLGTPCGCEFAVEPIDIFE